MNPIDFGHGPSKVQVTVTKNRIPCLDQNWIRNDHTNVKLGVRVAEERRTTLLILGILHLRSRLPLLKILSTLVRIWCVGCTRGEQEPY